jgi:threonine dehydratase
MTEISAAARQVAAASRDVAPRIAEHTLRTPLVELSGLSALSSSRIYAKAENLQRTGSFKVRGALAKVLAVSPEQRQRGIVTSSTGNHGLGVGYALARLGGRGVVCVPEHASSAKLAALARYPVEIRTMGREAAEAEALARELAAAQGMVYISPYNDPDVIAGQGTVGQEILEQVGSGPLDAVVVSVGGGGLISGVAAAIKASRPAVRIIGASPANDAAMAAAVEAGRIVEIDASPTFSDGTAGGVEPGSMTFPLCSELVDDWLLVSEAQLCSAVSLAIDVEHQLLEGAAGVALAAGLATAAERADQTIAVVCCGANISSSTLQQVLSRADAA